jgi:hypothetical protein
MANYLKPVIKKLRQEQSDLKRQLKHVGKVLENLASLATGAAGSKKSGRRATRKFSAKTRKRMAEARRLYWANKKKAARKPRKQTAKAVEATS